MKDNSSQDELLEDVFPEGSNLRETLLARSIRVSRRRHALRQTRFIGIAALLALLVLYFRPPHLPQARTGSKAGVPTGCVFVHTEPFPASAIATTRSGMLDAALEREQPVEIVETVPGNYHLIGDAELLSLVCPHPCALVRVGPNSEELIFLNPMDTNGSPMN
jgi:hypothetical protein